MLTPLKSLSLMFVMMSSMSVPILQPFSRYTSQPSLTQTCAGLLEPKGSGLGQLKSAFNSKNNICRLSWSISSHFVAIYCWNVRCNQKLLKIQQNLSFEGSRSFKVIDVDKSKKSVISACYDMQQVCTYLQPFSSYKSQERHNSFSEGVPLFDALVRGQPPHPRARNIVTINQNAWGSPRWKSRDPTLRRFDTVPQCDGRTDRQTDGRLNNG